MHGPRDCYTEGSKGSKSDTERQVSCDIAYVWNRKKKDYKWTYLQNRNSVTDVENKLVITRGWGERDILENWYGHIYTTVFKIDNY